MNRKNKRNLTPIQEEALRISRKIIAVEIAEKGHSVTKFKRKYRSEYKKQLIKIANIELKKLKSFKETSWERYGTLRIQEYKTKLNLEWDLLQPKRAERQSRKEQRIIAKRKRLTKRLNVKFISQFNDRFGTRKEQEKACFDAAKYIAKKGGTTIYEGKYGSSTPPEKLFKGYNDYLEKTLIKMGTEEGKGIKEDPVKAKQGRKYIDSELDSNRPIVVGVSYDPSYSNPSIDELSEHFVTIVGRGVDDKGNTYYEFHDPARVEEKNGSADNPYNRFYVDKNGGLTRAGIKDNNDNKDFVHEETYEVASIRRSGESLGLNK